MNEQWCFKAIATTDAQKVQCTFDTMSNKNYTAAVYCETIEGWFFSTAKATTITAKDNGGK